MNNMISEILRDKETMDAIVDYVIKEIERREIIDLKYQNKIHEEAMNAAYEGEW